MLYRPPLFQVEFFPMTIKAQTRLRPFGEKTVFHWFSPCAVFENTAGAG